MMILVGSYPDDLIESAFVCVTNTHPRIMFPNTVYHNHKGKIIFAFKVIICVN